LPPTANEAKKKREKKVACQPEREKANRKDIWAKRES